MKNNKVILSLGFIILVLVTVFIVSKNKPANPIEILKVEVGDMVEATYAIGTVKAENVYNLKTGVNTKMLERYVKIGQKVKKGQRLIRLDSFPPYIAPFDGIITVLNYEVGELVFANSTVLTLVNQDKYYLELNLDERSISKISIGNEAKILFENQKEKTTGRVRSIFSNADQFYVHLDFDQDSIKLLPGMTCDVSLITKNYKNAILIPLAAISPRHTVKKKINPNEDIKLDILYRSDKKAVVSNTDFKDGDELLLSNEKDSFSSRKSRSSSGGH